MITGRVPPTRSSLLRTRRRLERVGKGIELLTRKRRALVTDLFRIAHPAIAARAEVDAQAGTAYRALLAARAGHGDDLLTALGWPTRHLEVDVVVSESWGVATGAVERLVPIRRTLDGRGHAPSITGPAVTETAGAVERLVEVLLEAAATELRLRRLADALARTTRQVNTLDRRVRPDLAREAARVRSLLEEREREDHARLKRLTGPRAARPPAPGTGPRS